MCGVFRRFPNALVLFVMQWWFAKRGGGAGQRYRHSHVAQNSQTHTNTRKKRFSIAADMGRAKRISKINKKSIINYLAAFFVRAIFFVLLHVCE